MSLPYHVYPHNILLCVFFYFVFPCLFFFVIFSDYAFCVSFYLIAKFFLRVCLNFASQIKFVFIFELGEVCVLCERVCILVLYECEG